MNKYYYAEGESQFGPYTLDELKRFRITKDTLVWTEGMDDWIAAAHVQELETLFIQSPPKIPQQQNFSQPHPPQSQPYQKNPTSYQQQSFQENTATQPMPKTWLVPSILVTIFCCLPFGIVGIINATKVESLYKSGDIAGAIEASNKAGKWTKYALIGGLVIFIAYAIFTILSFGGLAALNY